MTTLLITVSTFVFGLVLGNDSARRSMLSTLRGLFEGGCEPSFMPDLDVTPCPYEDGVYTIWFGNGSRTVRWLTGWQLHDCLEAGAIETAVAGVLTGCDRYYTPEQARLLSTTATVEELLALSDEFTLTCPECGNPAARPAASFLYCRTDVVCSNYVPF